MQRLWHVLLLVLMLLAALPGGAAAAVPAVTTIYDNVSLENAGADDAAVAAGLTACAEYEQDSADGMVHRITLPAPGRQAIAIFAASGRCSPLLLSLPLTTGPPIPA